MDKKGIFWYKVDYNGNSVRKYTIQLNSMMINLVGTHTHTLDQKRRVSLPARFRPQLGVSVVITLGFQTNLAIYPTKEWERFTKQVLTLPITDKSTRQFRHFVFSNASESEIDNTGRILIPEQLCVHAGFKEKISFIGMKDSLEVWDEDLWLSYNKDVTSNSESLIEKVDELWQGI